MIWDYSVLDFGYRCIVFSFPGLKGWITVKLCHFMNFTDSPTCSNTCLRLISHYIHITDNYLSKMTMQYFGKAPIIILTILSQYRYQSICVGKYCVIWFCFPFLAFIKGFSVDFNISIYIYIVYRQYALYWEIYILIICWGWKTEPIIWSQIRLTDWASAASTGHPPIQ